MFVSFLKYHLFLFFCFGISIVLKSQSFSSFRAQYKTGFIYAHFSEIAYMVEENTNGFSLEADFKYDTAKQYAFFGEYPVSGLGLYHGSLSNPEVYGNATAVYSYLKTNLVRFNERFNLFFHLGAGIGYIDKTFSLDNNYNIAIGAPFNIFFESYMEGRVKLYPSLYFAGSFGLLHLSNGKMAEPNKGLNVVNTGLGLRYQFDGPPKGKPRVPKAIEKNRVSLTMATGLKRYARFDPGDYAIASFVVDYGRRLNQNEVLGFGLDVFYDQAIEAAAKRMNVADFDQQHLYRLGVHAGYELQVDRFYFPLQVGTYLRAKYVTISHVYTRIGARYRLWDHFFFNVTLKSHKFNADFLEFGFGYSILNV